MTIASPQTVGMASGAWCPYGLPGDLPADQRIDDGQAVVFETEPLAERLEFLGAPVLDGRCLGRPAERLPRRAPVAGRAGRRGDARQLRRAQPHPSRQPCRAFAARAGPRVPGVGCKLNDIGQAVPRRPSHPAGADQRLLADDLAVAASAATVTLFPAESRLELPVRPPRPEDERAAPLRAAGGSPPPGHSVVTRPPSRASAAPRST